MALAQSISTYNGYLDDVHIPEKEKEQQWYLEANINSLIHTLVREKVDIRTYRNYYNGVRDQSEFKYLTENFGIGTPSKLGFTNLIKPRVDALVGSMLEESFDYQVTCTDDKTIDLALEQKKNSRLTAIKTALDYFVKSNIEAVNQSTMVPGQGENTEQPTGAMQASEFMTTIQKIEDLHGTNFLSSYEVGAKDLIKFFDQDVDMDMTQKRKQLNQDLISTGECYYRVYVEEIGSDPRFKVIKPENLFYNKNTNSQYIDSPDCRMDGMVHREFMTKKQILMEYGKYMTQDQKDELFGEAIRNQTGVSLVSGVSLDTRYITSDHPRNQMTFSSLGVMEVFHCEWLAMNEVELDDEDIEDLTKTVGEESKVRRVGYRMDRYEGVKIGTVYVNCGKSLNISRTESRPMDCGYSYGGIVYNDRNGKPFSIVGALKDLQDVYDLTIFYRNNLIANSGVPGSRVNIAGIPKQLGGKFMERLMTFVAMKKNGFELIDPTEPGAQLFQHYGDFDNSVNGNSLAAIDNVLLAMERQADLIAATNKQMLGQIAERDAVENVKQGIAQSLMINADLFDLIRSNQKRLLTDLLKASKITYVKGKKGAYIVGSESFIFNVLPNLLSASDIAINVTYSSKDKEKLVNMKMLAKELVVANMLDPNTLIHIILSDSASEVKMIIDKAWAIKKQETSQVSQAQTQLEQLQQQVQQLTNELTKAQAAAKASTDKDVKLKEREIDLKQEDIENKKNIENRKIADAKEFNEQQIGVKKDLVQLEREQLYLPNSGSGAKEPKNNI